MGRRLLLVEDNPGDVKLFRLGVADAGLDDCLDVVGNGFEALDRIRNHKPDYIVLDLNIPGLDGCEVLEAVRHRRPRVPVVVLTGSDRAEDHERAYSLGCLCVYQKPHDAAQYLGLASSLARLAQLRVPQT